MLLKYSYNILALLFLFIQSAYWYFTAITAKKAKPFTKRPSLQSQFQHFILKVFEGIVVIQLLSLVQLFPYAPNHLLQTLGVLIVIMGVAIGIFARKTLNTNWTHAVDYQIKTNHALVTKGIYRVIRHPIYSGLILALLGSELIVNSYLLFVIPPLLFLAAYFQGKKEEALLSKHFGNEYHKYQKKTKMLIPYII